MSERFRDSKVTDIIKLFFIFISLSLTLPASAIKSSKYKDSENGILKTGKLKLSKSISACGQTSMKNDKPGEFKLNYQDNYCTHFVSKISCNNL